MATKKSKTKEKGVNLNMRPRNYSAVIKVVGVGGGGCNAITRMYKERLVGVDYLALNTDAQSFLSFYFNYGCFGICLLRVEEI